jgi:hypothetical protein
MIARSVAVSPGIQLSTRQNRAALAKGNIGRHKSSMTLLQMQRYFRCCCNMLKKVTVGHAEDSLEFDGGSGAKS